MARTSASAVEQILNNNYDGSSSLTPFIELATSMVDRLVALDTSGVLTSVQKELVERWLAAHFYCMSDPQIFSKTTGKSSGTITGVFGTDLNMTTYGQTAKMADWSGNLAKIGKSKAGMAWLGKAVSEQIAYEDRD